MPIKSADVYGPSGRIGASCGRCNKWQQIDSPFFPAANGATMIGECRAHAPQVVADPSTHSLISRWPYSVAAAWCMEFEPDKRAPPQVGETPLHKRAVLFLSQTHASEAEIAEALEIPVQEAIDLMRELEQKKLACISYMRPGKTSSDAIWRLTDATERT